MIPPALLSLIPTVIEIIKGKPKDVIIAETGERFLQQSSKGLLRSKTAGTATFALGAKMVGVYLLPLPGWLQHALAGAVVIEWGVQLYLRVITKDKI